MFVLVYHFLLCFVVYCCINHSISVFYLCTVSKIVNYKKGCTRLAAASDKVYQLLAHGRWFSPGSPASSTTKTGRHDIAEILLKVALNTINQSINHTMKSGLVHFESEYPDNLMNLKLWSNILRTRDQWITEVNFPSDVKLKLPYKSRMNFFQFFNWFQLFSFGRKIYESCRARSEQVKTYLF